MKIYSLNTPKSIKRELKGISDSTGINYEKIFLLNVFDDIYNTAMCTNVAVLGNKTFDNKIIHGRNLDYYFQKYTWDRAVILNYINSDRNSFLSITYPGIIGTLTAMNNKGITLGSLTSQIKKNNLFGIPTGFLYKKIIEESKNIDEVTKIINKNKTTIGNNLMITSKNDKKAVVYEITPQKIALRTSDSLITAANHFEILKDQNKYNSKSSIYRSEWSNELLQRINNVSSDYVIDVMRNLEVNKSYGEPIANNRNVISAIFLPDKNEFFLASNEVVPASQGRYYHFSYIKNQIKLINITDTGDEFLYFKNINFKKEYQDNTEENILKYVKIYEKSKSLYKPYKYSSIIEFLLENNYTKNVDKYISYLYNFINENDPNNFDNINNYSELYNEYSNKMNTLSKDNFYVQKNNFYYAWYQLIKNNNKNYINDIINDAKYYDWIKDWANSILNGEV